MPQFGLSDTHDDARCTNVFSSVPCQDKKCPVHHSPDHPQKGAPPLSNWFQTFTGKLIDALNPTPDMVDIQDIAHALSMTCRFGGHCRDFYSVAEHSVLVMKIGKLPPSVHESSLHGTVARLALLLHDAAEAYVGDIVTPVKNLLAGAHALERKWLEAIEKKFDLPNVLSLPGEYVKDADRAILSQEVATLFSPVLPEWWRKFEPPSQDLFLANPIQCLSPTEARRQFLHVFHSLQLQRGLPNPWTVQP